MSEFHFLPPICDFVTLVTPFNFACHVLPHIYNSVSIFTPFNIFPIPDSSAPLAILRGKPVFFRMTWQASLETYTLPRSSPNPESQPTTLLRYTPTPHRGGTEAIVPVDRFPTLFPSSSSVRRVRAPLRNAGHRRRGSSGDHHGDQPRTEVTSAWRHAGRRRYDGACHAGGARERQMSAPRWTPAL